MIIEFELQGSKCLHKGVFDTDGFWVRYEDNSENVQKYGEEAKTGFTIYSHCSFAFYHEIKEIVDLVYARLISVLRGSASIDIDNIGYFRKLNK